MINQKSPFPFCLPLRAAAHAAAHSLLSFVLAAAAARCAEPLQLYSEAACCVWQLSQLEVPPRFPATKQGTSEANAGCKQAYKWLYSTV